MTSARGGHLRLAAGASIIVALASCAGAPGPVSPDVLATDTSRASHSVSAADQPSSPTEFSPARTPSTASSAGQDADPGRQVPPSAALQTSFEGGFARIRPRLSGPAGVALVPVGGGQALTAGDLSTGVAWSTSKVPLAVAALRVDRSSSTRSAVEAAIRDSDNVSAERLWSVLGGGQRAASSVEAVLRDIGDGTTAVPSRRTRPPYTAFGQTQWSTELSARFAAHQPCLRDAAMVLDDMRRVSGSQRWGFWNLPGAAVKGGWGPVGHGYLVRQIAVVAAGDGQVGVGALVQSATFESGQRDLDIIADWARRFLPSMAGMCR